ncbi:MAG TPA: UDP-N-acetylmuramoyl-L-alanyl-D-glutamate--2,6-diaminopimelate ligase [Firmicutes bacterium]|nr:UDP-N-acetylmuramoyl-L-alanyl-D-glutamate--2,6-diaminopimelate ligase [Bacillota bacterium]
MEVSRDLNDLLKALPLARVEGSKHISVRGLAHHTKQVEPGFLFFCLEGNRSDGHDFIPQAVQAGAAVIVLEKDRDVRGVTKVVVPSVRAALPIISQQFFASPSAQLRLIGVTGTNGKTTVTHLLEAIFSGQGWKTGMLGTIKYMIGGEHFPTPATTPEAPDLQKILRHMVNSGATHGVMEVSSHALELGRVSGCDFDMAVLTNITGDHLDFHKTFERYLAAKGKLFSQLGGNFFKGSRPRFAVLNGDDPYYDYFLRQNTVQALSYGIDSPAEIRATDVAMNDSGVRYMLETPWGQETFSLQLVGKFNIYNALAATAVALLEKIPLSSIKEILEKITEVKGRFERVDLGQPFTVIVDYAHTPDGLENILKSARAFAKGKIITIFGCGGERDRSKRPLMGFVAARYSDYAILTSDNPRGEDPWQIIEEVEVGLRQAKEYGKGYTVQPERYEAIRLGIELARPDDLVIIAGKGHESYQVFADITVPFDDRQVAEEIITKRLSKIL